MVRRELTKEEIVRTARSLGAELVGFAPVARWEEYGDLPEDFYPHRVWPLTRTVIAMAVPSLLPIVETKISHLYRSQYNNTNSLLDEVAYRLAAFLNRNGHAAINICRDGYGPGTTREKPVAAFAHVWAGYYAGLGRIGWNHTLVTREFGPRHRLVSVLTALELEGDPMVAEELCNRCRLCEKACPTQAFSGKKSDKYSHMDKFACMSRRERFTGPLSHCGFCLKVCPMGDDRKLYQAVKSKKYFDEAKNPGAWSSGVGASITG
ncbi:MAG: 4Fe-4S binding protein [Thermacetogeniaceae bacterium]